VCIVLATVKKKGWSRAPTIGSSALSLEMSSCSLAGRVNFGPLLVNLEFGERKGKGQLNFTCNLLSSTALHIHLDAWMLDQREAAKPVAVRRPTTEDWPSRHIGIQAMSTCLQENLDHRHLRPTEL
jgi:hypothetical protein